ncbi:MAG: aminopeptidase P family protein [Planctomycetota bacterium]|jgi:Xaa-Pro aminopeptidase|nr:aminopeptidase P family protein [Planctomycetota bacterium]MDP7131766.1 aminopeptidase P family protein [Planctomycetota bacterium]MDP7253015.1 aminopeptidase P family protein [Planctomycetota bacterium]
MKSNQAALKQLRESMVKKRVDALYISNPPNIRYLSGFSTPADGKLVVTHNSVRLFTDFRYTVQTKEECFVPVTIWKGKNRLSHVKRHLNRKNIKTLGIEADHTTVGTLKTLKDAFDCRIKQTNGMVDELRVVKAPDEIERIRKAAEINDRAFDHMLGFLKPGLTEIDATLELEWFLRRNGAFEIAFDVIAAAGPNGAKPHAHPSKRKIKNNELLTLDFGSVWEGYRSDMTRTVGFGRPGRKLKKIYRTVLDAQVAGVEAIKPGTVGKDADRISRKIIKDAGYDKYFGHSLGHGVGLQIHELPRLAPHSKDILKPGMVVTVEPGIYVPDFAGVRIEDLVLVTEDGKDVLSNAPKELICL